MAEVTPTQQTTAPAATLPNVPQTWPGAFGVYQYSKQAVLRNWKLILLLTFVSGVLSLGSRNKDHTFTLWSLIASILSLVLSVVLTYVELESVRGKTLTAQQAFSKFTFGTALKVIGTMLLSGIVIAASLFAFIIPFFFVFPRVMLAPYFTIDKGLGPIDAITASWEATKGHMGKVYGIVGASMLMALSMIVLVGFYFVFMYSCAGAILYLYITKATVETPAPTTPVA